MMSETTETMTGQPAAGRQRRGLGVVYPMRVLGATLPIVTIVLYIREFSSFSPFHFLFIGLCLIHPHFFFLLSRKYDEARGKIDVSALLVDAFYLGLTIYVLGFSALPTFVMATVALANGLGMRGFRGMLLSGLALIVGVVLPVPFAGLHFDPRDSFAVTLACLVFLFIYFHLFALAAHNRASRLKWTRRELSEQKATVEIEKRRSDTLMHSIAPERMVKALERDGHLKPTTFDPVALLVVDFQQFSQAVDEHDPAELLDYLMHCFKAFDAIATRHGMEKLKTMGDIFIAIRGLPEPADDDIDTSLSAALEIRDFLADMVSSRKAYRSHHLEARIAVHGGKIVGGLVETPRLSYDVWGATVDTLLRIERQSSPGQVAVSEVVRRLATDAFDFTAAGSVPGRDGADIAFFSVDSAST